MLEIKLADTKNDRDTIITKEQAEQHIRDLFRYIGEDPERTGLLGSPERIVRMWDEIFRGYDPAQKPKITTFPNGEDGLVYNEMVVDTGSFHSMCEHHAMPFFGRYWFSYIPETDGRILGLSKIARMVDYCAARLQIQERLVTDIVDEISKALGPGQHSVALFLKGEHLCKTMRGVKKKGYMTSQCLTGSFKKIEHQAEFFNFINSNQ